MRPYDYTCTEALFVKMPLEVDGHRAVSHSTGGLRGGIRTKRDLMQRIVVTGSGGASKSTTASQIGIRLRIPVIHLDKL